MKTINIVAGGRGNLFPIYPNTQTEIRRGSESIKGRFLFWKPESFRRKLSVILTALRKRSSCRFKKRRRPIHVYQAEKDYTDLELALDWALQKEPETIRMFGVTGGRADHFLGNIQLLYKALHKNTDVELIDRQNDIQMFTAVIQLKKKRADAIFLSFHLRKRQTA